MAWLGTSGSNPGDVSTNGNLGVGETSPDVKIHATQGDATYGCLLKLETNGSYDGPRIAFRDGPSNKSWSIGSRESAANDGFSINEDGSETQWGTVRVVVKAGGNVGVGNVDPQEKLDVGGAIRIGMRSDTGATAGTVRWNTSISKLQVYDGTGWINLH
jgi:hypothetical protein